MRRSTLLSLAAAAALLGSGLATHGPPSFAQDEDTEMAAEADAGMATEPTAGMPGAAGVPDTTTTGSVTDGPPAGPVEVLPDTPTGRGVVTATEIQNGSSGAAGTGAGSGAPSAPGGE
jgi:hypothetical protein